MKNTQHLLSCEISLNLNTMYALYALALALRFDWLDWLVNTWAECEYAMIKCFFCFSFVYFFSAYLAVRHWRRLCLKFCAIAERTMYSAVICICLCMRFSTGKKSDFVRKLEWDEGDCSFCFFSVKCVDAAVFAFFRLTIAMLLLLFSSWIWRFFFFFGKRIE